MTKRIQIKGFPLIKMSSRELIEKTQGGSFYMNSLKYYRNKYKNDKDNVVGDPYEGKLLVHNAVVMVEHMAFEMLRAIFYIALSGLWTGQR